LKTLFYLGVGFVMGCQMFSDGPHRIEEVTGAHSRVVWLQDAWGHMDVFSDAGQLRLMSLDSRDGRGEQVRVEGPVALRKPLISPCGEWIVYSRGDDGGVWVLGWDGKEPHRLTDGLAIAVHAEDTETWVLVGREPVDANENALRRVVRVKLTDSRRVEPLWDAAPVGRDNFQVSADGKLAAGLFPWPKAGVADLQAGTWRETGRGCWTGMGRMKEPVMWILDGAHRNLTMVQVRTGERWQIPIARHAPIGGHEIYHPRWSSHPRYLAMTGPYKIRKGGNNIRGGGADVEIHVGRFTSDWRSVEAWVQVTENAHANFFPDVWVAGAELSPDTEPGPARVADELSDTNSAPVELEVRLLEISPTPSLDEISPYKQALAGHMYEVISAPEGFKYDHILIAHWVIRDEVAVENAPRETGGLSRLSVREYDSVPRLEGERLVIDVSDLLLPLYVVTEE
jgi:hypothetical protein